MAKLSAWLKKHLRSNPRPSPRPSPKKQPTDQPPPFLPSPRRPITPTSFDTPTCLFFALPYDIRSMILLMALGERALHVDLVHQEEAWKWRGAVCGRDMSAPFSWHLWNDECLLYAYRHKQFRENYNVGGTGFLLSCRQAYTEGIHVLYAGNCIAIQSEPLLLHLPRLIPLPRLASITSLEMTIRAQEDSSSAFSLDHLKPILDNIVTHCHHLRSLCISFKVADRDRGDEILPALPLVDAFYRSMQLRNMRVELPTSAHGMCRFEASEGHPHESRPKDWMFRPVWRSLDGEQPMVQSRSIKRYPCPPLKLPTLDGVDESVESSGYWLREGDWGKRLYHISNCGVPRSACP